MVKAQIDTGWLQRTLRPRPVLNKRSPSLCTHRDRPSEERLHEIVPFTVLQKRPGSHGKTPIVVTKDDGIRYGTTQEKLAKINAAFPQWGNSTTTGGNASQITDGAAAVLVMTRREAEKRGLSILGKQPLRELARFLCFDVWMPRGADWNHRVLVVQPRIAFDQDREVARVFE